MLKVMAGCSYKRNDDFWVSGITTHEPAIIERERESAILLHFKNVFGYFCNVIS